MYRPTDPQRDLFDAGGMLPPKKVEACRMSWAGPFRQHALPILLEAEPDFADLYDDSNGRPNRSIALLVGMLILKEASDLTDEEVLAALDFDTRWWYAFELKPEESHLCQKTLHNFRVKLVASEKGQLVFRRVTDGLIKALKIDVSRQRLDSTHILSNFAQLNRLGLFCETIRVFLHALKKSQPALHDGLPEGLLRRHAEDARYRDARKEEGQRRLKVVARDAYRLVARFKEHPQVKQLKEFALLDRLLSEQCEITSEPVEPDDDDGDRGDGPARAKLKDVHKIGGYTLQTPHDEDATYSGHKGKGYSAQISETCVKKNPVQLVTHVETRPAAECDQKRTVPIVDKLVEAGQAPEELVIDTNYSSAGNAAESSERGVNLLGPAPTKAKPEPNKEYSAPEAKCPKTLKKAGEWLRRQEAQADFKERYAIRAGIESTNSELKRVQGLDKLRVRGEPRVSLAVQLKAVGLNLRRALRYWTSILPGVPEAAASPA